MHKSKLGGFIIDCHTPDLESASAFWAAALGMETRSLSPEESGRYIGLSNPRLDLDIEVQSVEHPSRVHLDIETDDVEAEVTRLETLGAKRVGQVKSWWVMEAPTGHRFCVVRKFSERFDQDATQWP